MSQILEEIAVRRYLRRIQPALEFPPTLEEVCRPFIVEAGRRAAKRNYLKEMRPRPYPRGYFQASLRNPDWRREYHLAWHQRRVAKGLPGLTPCELASNRPLQMRRSA